MIVIAILLLLVALECLFLLRRGNVVLQHQFRLYALRDEVRAAVMRGEIQANNWVFQYLDSSLAKTINALPSVSFWRVGSMVVFSPYEPKLKIRLDHLFGELRKPENEALTKIYLHYLAEVGFFLSRQHSNLWMVVSGVFRLLKLGKWLKEKFRLAKEILTAAPETSTLPEFISS